MTGSQHQFSIPANPLIIYLSAAGLRSSVMLAGVWGLSYTSLICLPTCHVSWAVLVSQILFSLVFFVYLALTDIPPLCERFSCCLVPLVCDLFCIYFRLCLTSLTFFVVFTLKSSRYDFYVRCFSDVLFSRLCHT